MDMEQYICSIYFVKKKRSILLLGEFLLQHSQLALHATICSFFNLYPLHLCTFHKLVKNVHKFWLKMYIPLKKTTYQVISHNLF